MEFLPIIFLSVVFILTFLVVVHSTKKIRSIFLKKLINKSLCNKPIYCSLLVDNICLYILKSNKKRKNKIINALIKNDFTSAFEQISDKKISNSLRLIDGKKVEESNDILHYLLRAKYYLKTNNQDKAGKILQKISGKKMSPAQKMYLRYLLAQVAVFEGDMLTATEDLSTVLRFFKKKKMCFEEAEAYFLLGTIYRISGLFDTSEFMLRTSCEIYSQLNSTRGEAESLGTLGLLMSVQKRFDEAKDYYSKALEKAKNHKNLQEFIILQQIMTEFLKGDLKTANKEANTLLKKAKNNMVKASANDILSRISLAEKKYSVAVKYAKESAHKFLVNKNYPAFFESSYIYASALFENGKLAESESVLRDLIEKEKKYSCCYHIANVYTLLGLVLLKNKQYDRAKAVFNQALSKEFYNDRKVGIAIDYANLAIVEKNQGNTEEAFNNIQKALAQVKDIDDELYNKIKSLID